jgi:hypothetical protein
VGNGLSDTPDLAGDPDLEPVRMVVTAIALVAVDAADGNPPDTWKELLAAASGEAAKRRLSRAALRRGAVLIHNETCALVSSPCTAPWVPPKACFTR